MIHQIGDDALSVDIEPFDVRIARAEALRLTGLWLDVVPGKLGVTVSYDPCALTPEEARDQLAQSLAKPLQSADCAPQTHDLVADFGGSAGPDLETLSSLHRMSPEALIAHAVQAELRVDMLGFTPGFAYLSGTSPKLKIDRLGSPRQSVPAGSVGMITGQIGLYSLSGPGGWPIIGRLRESLFDLKSDAPFRLQAGDIVRLVMATS